MVQTATGSVGQVVWATAVEAGSNAPASPVTTMPEETGTIYAVVPVSALAKGARLAATWTYNGTPIDGMQGQVVGDGRGGHAWAEFHLSRGTLPKWPSGTYQVTVSLDGQTVQKASIDVGG